MTRADREFEPTASAELLEVLRTIQHQLANTLSAVASWTVAVDRKAAAFTADRGPLDALSVATEQALSVAACLRHLLTALESKRGRVSGRTLLGQVRDFVHALATRSVEVRVELSEGPDWTCPIPDCFLLVARVLESYKDPLRQADRIVVAAERSLSPASDYGVRSSEGAGLIRLLIFRPAAAPAAPVLSESLRDRLAQCQVQVSWQEVSPTESVLQIALPCGPPTAGKG